MKKIVTLILLIAALGGALAFGGSFDQPGSLPAPESPAPGIEGFNSWAG